MRVARLTCAASIEENLNPNRRLTMLNRRCFVSAGTLALALAAGAAHADD